MNDAEHQRGTPAPVFPLETSPTPPQQHREVIREVMDLGKALRGPSRTSKQAPAALALKKRG